MSAITGFISPSGTPDSLKAVLNRMTAGPPGMEPDAESIWIDPAAGAALGYRPAPAAAPDATAARRPVISHCGRYVFCCIGSIYNYLELREELKITGPGWKGRSDTALMLEYISRKGANAALQHINGAFAFTLFDKQKKELVLARDSLGIKPLYYGWAGKDFVFASELRPLCTHPSWNNGINRQSLCRFLKYGYIPAPHSIYNSVWKLMPAQMLTVPVEAVRSGKIPEPVYYWDPAVALRNCSECPVTANEREASDELERLLLDSINGRITAGVPAGAFLSGGYDSSTIAALMQTLPCRPVRTFSIGFYEPGYDEAGKAREVARRLGSEHTELYVTHKDAMSVIPMLPQIYDEPFSDSSQIPAYLASKLARHDVTVCLSGDGGDELFYGYRRYRLAKRVWSALRPVLYLKSLYTPAGGRNPDSERPDRLVSFSGRMLSRYMPKKELRRFLAAKKLLETGTATAVYDRLIQHWDNASDIVTGAKEDGCFPAVSAVTFPVLELEMMYRDLTDYTPNDILVKVGRASAAAGLEVRMPMLDRKVVEFAWRLPVALRCGRGPKRLLRRVLYKYIPRKCVDRPKMGFGIPIHSWLRGPLRDWAEALLDQKRLHNEGYLDPSGIREKWDAHIDGSMDMGYYLWDVLMFQAWLGEYR